MTDDVQVALAQGASNPIEWLQTQWPHLVETVQVFGDRAGQRIEAEQHRCALTGRGERGPTISQGRHVECSCDSYSTQAAESACEEKFKYLKSLIRLL